MSNHKTLCRYLIPVLICITACRQNIDTTDNIQQFPLEIIFPRECLFGAYYMLSPSNEWVVCHTYLTNSQEVLVKQPDDNEWIQVIPPTDSHIFSVKGWSPDDSQLAIEIENEVWLYQADNWETRTLLTSRPEIADMSFNWSPDGEYIALVSIDGALALLSSDGQQYEHIFDEKGVGFFPGSTSADVSWSPDSSMIAYWRFPSSFVFEDLELWLLNLETREETFLSAPDLVLNRPVPVWSPDGGYIALAVGSEDNGFEVMVIDIATTEERKFPLPDEIKASVGSLTWSLDGDSIAFVAKSDSANVWVLSLTTGDVEKITDTGKYAPIYKWTDQGIIVLHRPSDSEGSVLQVLPYE